MPKVDLSILFARAAIELEKLRFGRSADMDTIVYAVDMAEFTLLMAAQGKGFAGGELADSTPNPIAISILNDALTNTCVELVPSNPEEWGRRDK